MMKFRYIQVNKTQENAFFIEWETFDDIRVSGFTTSDYNFKIYRSYDPASGFEQLDTTIDGNTGPLSYTDWEVQYQLNKDRYYKVVAINKSDSSNIVESSICHSESEWDGVLESIKYVEEVLYDMYIGNVVYVLKRKSDGARCPDCWSELRYSITKSHCDTCNSTGFVDGGYYDPIKIQMQIDANPKISEIQVVGETTEKTMKGRLSNFPLIRPRDLLIFEDTGIRYSAIKIDITKLPNISHSRRLKSGRNHIVSQILTLQEINPDDSEYNVPFDPSKWGLVKTISNLTVNNMSMSSTGSKNKNISGHGDLQTNPMGASNG